MDNQNQSSPETQSIPVTQLPSSTKTRPIWIVILLFFIFPPVALLIAFKQKSHHKLLPIFLWIYAGLILTTLSSIVFSSLPQLHELHKSTNTPFPEMTNFAVWGLTAFLIIQIIFGFIINIALKTIGSLSKNLLIITLLFFVVDMISPIFIVLGVNSAINNVVSNVGEVNSTTKTLLITPSPIPTTSKLTGQSTDTSDWKIYTNSTDGYSIKYPVSLTLEELLSDTSPLVVLYTGKLSRDGDSPLTPYPTALEISVINKADINSRFNIRNASDYADLRNPNKELKIEPTKINNLPGVVFYFSEYNPHYFLDSPDGNRIFTFTILAGLGNKEQRNKDFNLLNDVLETFKFTDSSASIKRQFDVNALFFKKQKYPTEITAVSEDNLVAMTCSEYDHYGTNKSEEITNFKKIVQKNYPEKLITGFQYCKTQDQRIIASYGLGPCGGGCSGEPHIGLISKDTFHDLATMKSNFVAYFGCRQPLQLTSGNILYYECGGVDGGGAYSSIYKIDLNNKKSVSILSCTSQTDTSVQEPWTTTNSCK